MSSSSSRPRTALEDRLYHHTVVRFETNPEGIYCPVQGDYLTYHQRKWLYEFMTSKTDMIVIPHIKSHGISTLLRSLALDFHRAYPHVPLILHDPQRTYYWNGPCRRVHVYEYPRYPAPSLESAAVCFRERIVNSRMTKYGSRRQCIGDYELSFKSNVGCPIFQTPFMHTHPGHRSMFTFMLIWKRQVGIRTLPDLCKDRILSFVDHPYPMLPYVNEIPRWIHKGIITTNFAIKKARLVPPPAPAPPIFDDIPDVKEEEVRLLENLEEQFISSLKGKGK